MLRSSILIPSSWRNACVRAALLCTLSASLHCSAQVLYNVTFEPPRYGLGILDFTEFGGTDAPSRQVFGHPSVVNSALGRSLKFDTTGYQWLDYDQIEFALRAGADTYVVRFDAVFSQIGLAPYISYGSFTILFDTPIVQNVLFSRTAEGTYVGNYSSIKQSDGSYGFGRSWQPFIPSATTKVEIIANLRAETMVVRLNDATTLLVPFHSYGGDVETLRFSASNPGTATVVYIDNIIIKAVDAPVMDGPLLPGDLQVNIGATAHLAAPPVSGTGPFTYQWFKDGSAIAGANTDTYDFTITSLSNQGNYYVTISNEAGLVTSRIASVSVDQTRLINISSRAIFGAGDASAIAGFIVQGTASRSYLIRAVGPKLSSFGVTTPAKDPRFSLYNSAGQVVAANDNWGTGSIDTVTALEDARIKVGAFPFDTGSKDAAVLVQLPAGAYTVVATDNTGSSGVGLVEVYEVNSSLIKTGKLVNISTRSSVGSGENVLIAGTIVSGVLSKRLLVRGVGPGLTAYGVSNVLTNPRIRVIDGNGKIVGENDDWGSDSTVASAISEAGAFPFSAGSKDAATVVFVPPGAYTVVLEASGTANQQGAALVEIYELP